MVQNESEVAFWQVGGGGPVVVFVMRIAELIFTVVHAHQEEEEKTTIVQNPVGPSQTTFGTVKSNEYGIVVVGVVPDKVSSVRPVMADPDVGTLVGNRFIPPFGSINALIGPTPSPATTVH